MLREVQKIEHEYRDKDDGHHIGKGGKGPSGGYFSRSGAIFDQNALFSGLSRDKGEIMCSPALLEYCAKELADSTNVHKQLRKADVGLQFAQKNQRGTKKKEEG